MGCGCGGGGGSSAPTPPIRMSAMVAPAKVTPQNECPYTLEMVESWLTQAQCFKNKGLYVGTSITQRQLNIYIGVLMSAQANSANICYFQTQLAEVQNFILLIQSQGQCQ